LPVSAPAAAGDAAVGEAALEPVAGCGACFDAAFVLKFTDICRLLGCAFEIGTDAGFASCVSGSPITSLLSQLPRLAAAGDDDA
jgi:hypothetical protein